MARDGKRIPLHTKPSTKSPQWTCAELSDWTHGLNFLTVSLNTEGLSDNILFYTEVVENKSI